ncbi:hypothetical protein BYT27DRAFT_7192346 [Phlegmacium glaucopus]|nr:hypothetical protein BYT27DRAFT_7192346 [Phlegmacium glaucopus]
MSNIEDSPSSVETPAIPAHSTNTQATHHLGAAAREGIVLTRHYVTRTVQDVIKPAINTFLETFDTNPRVAAVVGTPALLGFLIVLAFFTISTVVLVIWTILTIMFGIIFVIIGGIVSFFFKLLIVILATIPLAAIATGLLIGANTVSQSIISRMPRNGVTQTVGEVDWKSVAKNLINFGKKLGPGFATAWEGLMVLRAALHNAFMAFKSGIEDLHNARVESRRSDRSDPPSDPTAETSGEPSQGNSDGVRQTWSVLEYTELPDFQPEGLKRRAPFPQTSEDVADDVQKRA